jgi:hypothetical protein
MEMMLRAEVAPYAAKCRCHHGTAAAGAPDGPGARVDADATIV